MPCFCAAERTSDDRQKNLGDWFQDWDLTSCIHCDVNIGDTHVAMVEHEPRIRRRARVRVEKQLKSVGPATGLQAFIHVNSEHRKHIVVLTVSRTSHIALLPRDGFLARTVQQHVAAIALLMRGHVS